jgi:hypothetical protein
LERPILARIGMPEVHSETIRYNPLGASDKVEIGNPYIPMSLLPVEPPAILLLGVRWVLTTNGRFRITRVKRPTKLH